LRHYYTTLPMIISVTVSVVRQGSAVLEVSIQIFQNKLYWIQ